MSSSAEANPDGPQHQDAFSRLIRTLSGRNVSADASAPPPPAEASVLATPSADSGVEVSTPGEPLERTLSNSSSQRIRMNIGERLKRLGAKLRKTDKGVPSSPKVTLGEIQPPDTSSGSGTSDTSPPGPSHGHAKLLSMVAELDEPSSSTPPAKTNDPPEADTLAKRIQTLIDSLPFPAPRQNRPLPIIKPPKPPARERDGRPIPPPNATPIKDSRLIAFLSSATIMNGSSANGRPSIWSVLEGIGAPAHGFPPIEGDDVEGGDPESERPEGSPGDGDDSVFSEDSSVMIYSPLIPGQEDLVELAELVPVSVEEEVIPSKEVIDGTSWTTVWPLSILYGETPAATKAARRLSGDTVISPGRTSNDSTGRRVRVQTVRAWVPSDTKLSVQAMWWGYRLYLPPPVLDILSDKTIEATKRAAMITAALTWIFNNLPVNALPPAVRPAAILLQRIVPYLGYIGTFISWSWSTIKSYDVGGSFQLFHFFHMPFLMTLNA
ncbi:hypothetical protein M413DRAFT_345134 [Hebeloma cylindrosporum]|uniref:Uncharacterized protein n=1 Tax=Hebeloma cylindrosporum TaxID=76867 RepID=A0A0C3CA37_HEBCY|nr:hypothetical protein M413DRAFT_345134 [Hebeloma cylindrosporum h7]